MNTNTEILNYLNLINTRLGKLYKLSGYNPLPNNFVLTEEKIKERLYLGQMQCKSYPKFVFEEKKSFKQHLKNSLKNIKNILKNSNIKGFDDSFVKRMEFYFNCRREVTQMIIKDFRNVDFDEVCAFEEIFQIDPIFAELLPEIFDEKIYLNKINPKLQTNYFALYDEKIKLIEKKIKKDKKKEQKNILLHENIKQINVQHKKINKNDKKPAKIASSENKLTKSKREKQ